MKVGVFHPGTQHSWQTSLALQQLDRLAWFATSLFYKPDQWPYRLETLLPGRIGARLHAEFSRFAMPALDPALVRTSGAAEWLERIANRLSARELARKLDRVGNERFVRQIAGAITAPGDLALWGYNGSSRSSFALAREHGRPRILDRTIGDGRAYNDEMAALQDRYGDWFLAIEREIPRELIEHDEEEYALADKILVGCEYAAQTLRDRATSPGVAQKLHILPYCYDERLFANLPPPGPVDRNGPVKFIYLGLVIPRKGIHHVLEAFDRLAPGEAELTLVGDMKIPAKVWARYSDRVRHIPTVARSDVPGLLASHHALLFPTYFEGGGIVLYEALAAGCALIQSDRASLAVTDDTGVLLDRLDTDSLFAAMRTAIDDRGKLDYWRSNAQAQAVQYNFAAYRTNIADFLAKAGI